MKYWLVLFCFFSLAVNASEIQVSRMTLEPQMERSFVLKTNLTKSVTLDCQSFVQGLYLGPRHHNDFLMLEPQECEELYQRILQTLKGSEQHCLEIEDTIRSDYTCA